MSQLSQRNVIQLHNSSSVEQEARQLQLSLWHNRHELLQGRNPKSPLDLFEPGIALEFLGFSVHTDPELGEMHYQGRRVLVAGLIDRRAMSVRISPQYSMQEQRFTAAHELGHAVMHPGSVTLHRDRVVNGPTPRRERVEKEADEFASCFLMPARLVFNKFFERFNCEVFSLNHDAAYGLQLGSRSNALQRVRNTRDVSYLVARAQSYMGVSFESLASCFQVSPTAMAIRLEELGLVEDFSSGRAW